MRRTNSKSTPEKVPVSPATRVLTSRAINKRSPWKSPKKSLAPPPPQDLSDSDNSTYSHERLVEMLGRQSWKQNLRESVVNPTFDHGRESNDRSSLDIKSRPKRSTLKQSSSRIYLPDDETPEEDANHGQRTPDVLGRRSSRDSLSAFKPSGPVRHSDSEDSEVDVQRPRLRRSPRKVADKRLEALMPTLPETKTIQDEVGSDPESPIKVRRKRKNSILANQTQHLDLQLNATEHSVVQGAHSESSEADSPDLRKLVRKRFKKSVKADQTKYFDLSPLRTSESGKSSIAVQDDSDSDSDMILTRPARAKKSTLATKTENLNLQLNSTNSEGDDASNGNSSDDEQVSARPKRTREAKAGLKMFLPSLEKETAPDVDSGTDTDQMEISKRQSLRISDKTNTEIELSPITPKKIAVSEKVASDVEETPHSLPRRLTRSFKENLGTSHSIILSPYKQSNNSLSQMEISGQESPLKLTRSRVSMQNSTLIEMPALEESNGSRSKLDEERGPEKLLKGQERLNKREDTDEEDTPIQKRLTRSRKSKKQSTAINLSPDHNSVNGAASSSDGEIVTRKGVVPRKSSKAHSLRLSPFKSPAKPTETENNSEGNDDDMSNDEQTGRKRRQTLRKSPSTLVELPPSHTPEKVDNEIQSSSDEGTPTQRRKTRSRNSKKKHTSTQLPPLHNAVDQDFSSDESEVIVRRGPMLRKSSRTVSMKLSPFKSPAKQTETDVGAEDHGDDLGNNEHIGKKSRQTLRKSPSTQVQLPPSHTPEKANKKPNTYIQSSSDESTPIKQRQKRSRNSKEKPTSTQLPPVHHAVDPDSSSDEPEEIVRRTGPMLRKNSRTVPMKLSPFQSQRKSLTALLDLPSVDTPEKVNQYLNTGALASDKEVPSNPATDTNLFLASNAIQNPSTSSGDLKDVDSRKRREVKSKSSLAMSMKMSPLKSPAKEGEEAGIDNEENTADDLTHRGSTSVFNEDHADDDESNDVVAKRPSSAIKATGEKPLSNLPSTSMSSKNASKTSTKEVSGERKSIQSSRKEAGRKSASEIQEEDLTETSDDSEKVIIPKRRAAVRKSDREITFDLSPLASSTINSGVDPNSKNVSESSEFNLPKRKIHSMQMSMEKSKTRDATSSEVGGTPSENSTASKPNQSAAENEAQDKIHHGPQKDCNSPEKPTNIRKDSAGSHVNSKKSDEQEKTNHSKQSTKKSKSKVMHLSMSPLQSSHSKASATSNQINADQAKIGAASEKQAVAHTLVQNLNDSDLEIDWNDHSDLTKNMSVSSTIDVDAEIQSKRLEKRGAESSAAVPDAAADKTSDVGMQGGEENMQPEVLEESAAVSDESTIHTRRTNLRQNTPKRSSLFKGFTLFSPEKSKDVASDSSDGEVIQPKRGLKSVAHSKEQTDLTLVSNVASKSSRSNNTGILETISERSVGTPKSVEKPDQTRKLSLFAKNQLGKSSKTNEGPGKESGAKVQHKKISSMRESSTMELDYSMDRDDSHELSTSKKSIKDPVSMFLASPDESQDVNNEEPTDGAAKQNSSDSDSDSGEDDTPVVFKRRRISYQKSKDQPSLSLKFSFQSTGKGEESAERESLNSPDMPTKSSKKNSNTREKQDSEGTANEEEISLLDEQLQRHTMFRYTGESNANDILRSAQRRASIGSLNSGQKSQTKEKTVTPAASTSNPMTGSIEMSKPSQESARRNLQKQLEQTEEESIQSQEQLVPETEEPRTSTPVDDVTLTAQDIAEAVDLMESHGEQIINKSEARIYTADDFKSVVESYFLQPQQTSKSKKIFSLADLEREMKAVRSPSILINSSKRVSMQEGKNLFSIQDFERALMKLKNKTIAGARFSFMAINEISNIRKSSEVANRNTAATRNTPVLAAHTSAGEQSAVSQTLVYDTPEQEDKGENQTVFGTPDSDGGDKTQSESEKTEEESQSVHTEVEDTVDDDTNKTIESDPSTKDNSEMDAEEEEIQTQEITVDEQDDFGPGDNNNNSDSSEEEIVEKNQGSQNKKGSIATPPLWQKRSQSIGKHQSLITSFLSQASARSSTTARRSILSSEMSPPPQRYMQDDLDESGLATMRDREQRKIDLAKQYQERMKRGEAEVEAMLKKPPVVKKRAPSKSTPPVKKRAGRNPKGATSGFKQIDIMKELKRDQWVNKRLLKKLEKYFNKYPPRVRNDFLRTLSININSVLRQKKVKEENVRKVMKACHKAGVANNFYEFTSFMRDYLPSSFERKAFMDNLFRVEYYDFE